jgi:alpha-tubulin suppressor-like RCC1 family protein
MGIAKDNIEVPTEVCWQEKELENYEIELKTVILRDDLFKPKGALSQIRSIEWGEEHGLMLDKKGRLFGMGRTN